MDNGKFLHDDILEQPPEAPAYPVSEAKRAYRGVGGALLGFLIASVVTTNVVAIAMAIYSVALLDEGWVNSLLSLFSIYLVGGVTFCLLMLKTKPQRPEKSSLSVSELFLYSMAALGCMYALNHITLLLSSTFSFFGIETPTALQDSLTSTNIWLALFSVLIAAPVLEELFFRRFICDRLAKYGKWQAVIFSGLAFSLFHMNFEQVFYTFGLGCILAAVYVKTGKLRYTILMHFIVNLVGTVPSLALIKLGVLDVLEELLALVELGAFDMVSNIIAENVWMLVFLVMYLLAGLIFTVTCGVVLALQVKSIFTGLKGEGMPKSERWNIMFSSGVTMTYMIICIVITFLAML